MVFCGSLILQKAPRAFTGFSSTNDKSILMEMVPFLGAEFDDVYLVVASQTPRQLETIPDEEIETVWYENKTIDLRIEFKAFLKRELPKGSALNS
jgi:hypothetical protein